MSSSYIKSKIIECPHAFSTRCGGVSSSEFSTLNLGFEYGDKIDNVKTNWKIFSNDSEVCIDNLVWTKQIHQNNVKIVKEADINKGDFCTKFEGFDGLITNENNITLTIFTADCAPVLLHDKNNNVIAALHCGWKPLCSDVIKNGIDAMLNLGAKSNSINAAIGPCIGKCCFEVGKEVIIALDNLLGEKSCECYSNSQNKDDKYFVDLQKAVELRLCQLGVQNIEKIDECTSCNTNKYFSYRKETGKTGRMASIIRLD